MTTTNVTEAVERLAGRPWAPVLENIFVASAAQDMDAIGSASSVDRMQGAILADLKRLGLARVERGHALLTETGLRVGLKLASRSGRP
jgi:hypothetical protein